MLLCIRGVGDLGRQQATYLDSGFALNPIAIWIVLILARQPGYMYI